MAMRATSIRFSDSLWRLIAAKADEEGLSASQFIRESVVLRIALDDAQTMSPKDWRRAVESVRGMLEDDE
jgi:hypothetical protein